MTEAAVLTEPPKRTLRDKLFYGFGSVAYGVKDNGFGVLLMLYYNQVLGLPVATVAFALMIVLICDAIVDPILGHISDNLRTAWGRRHPFMYASILPVSLSYLALWNPPSGLSEDQLLIYLIVVAVAVRTFINFYEVPSTALVTDLSPDYNQRTSFLSYRYFFGWWGGLTMNILAFSVFLSTKPGGPAGQLQREGYQDYALFASALMAIAILTSALGTHRLIPTFRQPPPRRPFDARRVMRELGATLANRPFLIIVAAGMFNVMAFGIGGAMVTYIRTFFWELTGQQIAIITLGNFGSAYAGLVLAPKLSAWIGKKRGCLLVVLLQLVLSPLVYLGRFADVMPPNGSDALLAILFVSSFITTTLLVISGILTTSMIADAVEHGEIKTGRRTDGFYFAANSFIGACLAGFGVFAAGLILAFAQFPEGAQPGQVADAVLFRMMVVEIAAVAGLHLLALVVMSFYPISKAKHEANLRTLAEQLDTPKTREASEAAALAERGGSPVVPAGASPV
jgi:Na+/melibiose symporter-like transporter